MRSVFPLAEAESVERGMQSAVLIIGGSSGDEEYEGHGETGRTPGWWPRDRSAWAMLG
jgi:homoserine acetyltransferase